MKRISNKVSSGSTYRNNLLVILADIALIFKNFGPVFSILNPCLSLPSVPKCISYKQKWTIIFGILVMRRHGLTLWKDIKWRGIITPLRTLNF